MEEEKTLIRFYHSNNITAYTEDTDGVENDELLKLCSMLEMAKIDILKRVTDKYMEEK